MAMKEGELRKLIDTAAKQDDQQKKLAKAVKKIKETLADIFLDRGKPAELSGDKYVATARYTDKYEAINPLELFNLLEARGLSPKFFDVVKVDNTALKDVLSGDEISELKGASTAQQVSIGFKKLEKDK